MEILLSGCNLRAEDAGGEGFVDEGGDGGGGEGGGEGGVGAGGCGFANVGNENPRKASRRDRRVSL